MEPTCALGLVHGFAVLRNGAGGPKTTRTLLPGVRHLVFGVGPMLGLETLFLQGSGDEAGRIRQLGASPDRRAAMTAVMSAAARPTESRRASRASSRVPSAP